MEPWVGKRAILPRTGPIAGDRVTQFWSPHSQPTPTGSCPRTKEIHGARNAESDLLTQKIRPRARQSACCHWCAVPGQRTRHNTKSLWKEVAGSAEENIRSLLVSLSSSPLLSFSPSSLLLSPTLLFCPSSSLPSYIRGNPSILGFLHPPSVCTIQ